MMDSENANTAGKAKAWSGELPSLALHGAICRDDTKHDTDYYTAETVREICEHYGRAAIGAALDAAAQAAEQTDVATFRHGGTLHDDGGQTRSDIAAAIRALNKLAPAPLTTDAQEPASPGVSYVQAIPKSEDLMRVIVAWSTASIMDKDRKWADLLAYINTITARQHALSWATALAADPGMPQASVDLMPKRTAFINWLKSRHLDPATTKDAWGAQTFAHSHIQAMWEGWFNAPIDAAPQAKPDEVGSPEFFARLGECKNKNSIFADVLFAEYVADFVVAPQAKPEPLPDFPPVSRIRHVLETLKDEACKFCSSDELDTPFGKAITAADDLSADLVDFDESIVVRAASQAAPVPATPWIAVEQGLPNVAQNDSREFIIACRRGHNGKTYVFAADYLNAKLLQTEDDDCPEEGLPFTGWHRERDDSGDYDTAWHPVCQPGDEVTHWAELYAAPDAAQQSPGAPTAEGNSYE